MKKRTTLGYSLLFILILLFGCVCSAAAQTEEYIPVHSQEELADLFGRVKGYLDENGEKILALLDDTQSQVVTNALIRSWGITQYEDATPRQIDDAYDTLFNMSLFLGLAADPNEALSTGQMFEYAVQLLDQEYYDLLEKSGEDPENIEYAAYLRDIAEALVEDPESFTPEEVEDFVFEIYSETYLVAGLKAIAHTEALPAPEELFAEEEGPAMRPNPMKEYPSAEPLNDMLGIKIPELPEKFGAEIGYYSIIADILAESEYNFPDGGKLVLRLSPEADLDISGVYGAEFYKDLVIAGTDVEIDTYQDMLVARGTVKTLDGTAYSFAVDAEGLDEARFYDIVTFFVESCVNSQAVKQNGME